MHPVPPRVSIAFVTVPLGVVSDERTDWSRHARDIETSGGRTVEIWVIGPPVTEAHTAAGVDVSAFRWRGEHFRQIPHSGPWSVACRWQQPFRTRTLICADLSANPRRDLAGAAGMATGSSARARARPLDRLVAAAEAAPLGSDRPERSVRHSARRCRAEEPRVEGLGPEPVPLVGRHLGRTWVSGAARENTRGSGAPQGHVLPRRELASPSKCWCTPWPA